MKCDTRPDLQTLREIRAEWTGAAENTATWALAPRDVPVRIEGLRWTVCRTKLIQKTG